VITRRGLIEPPQRIQPTRQRRRNMYISHLLAVITFYGSLFPAVFRLIFRTSLDAAFLSLVSRIALLSQSCFTEDQKEETVVWFLTKGRPHRRLVLGIDNNASSFSLLGTVRIVGERRAGVK
jgi:hypothetical protein